MRGKRRLTLRERRQSAAKLAMPEVKRMVKKHGRAAVNNCLAKLKAHEKAVQRLSTLKAEAAALARTLG